MKLVGISIFGPLTFKCKILGQFESLTDYKRFICWMAKLATQQLFPYRSCKFLEHENNRKMLHFNVSDLKIENLTNFIMLFPFLLSI